MARRGGLSRLAPVVIALLCCWAPTKVLAFTWRSEPEWSSLDRYFDRGFARSPIWDDGLSEISRYAGREVRGGVPRDAEWIVLLRREVHRPGVWVATDDVAAPSTIEVLKVDSLQTIQAGIAVERRMLSSVFTRRDLVPVRTVFTSQDWMGQTWKELSRSGGSPIELQYSSYWDGEGRGSRTLEKRADAVVPFDDLVILLRALRADAPASFTLDVLPSLVSSRVGDTAVVKARVETQRGESLKVAGRSWHARRTDVSRPGSVDTLWYDGDGAGPLLRWRKADGTTWSLVETSRLAHWKWEHPGDSLSSASQASRSAAVNPPGPR